MFLGMASGPCNVAIFSKIPYAIYKNPDHHSKEMKRELGTKDHFSFAGSYQKIYRMKETEANLREHFFSIYDHLCNSSFKESSSYADSK